MASVLLSQPRFRRFVIPRGKSAALRRLPGILHCCAKVRSRCSCTPANLKRLRSIAQGTAETLSLAEMVPHSLQKLVALVPCDFAIAYFIDADGTVNSFSASSVAEASSSHGRLVDDLAQAATQCTGDWFVDDVTMVPELMAMWTQHGIRSMAILPMTRKDRCRTTLVLLYNDIALFAVDETQFLKALARPIALGVENSQLYESSLSLIDKLAGEIEERKRAEKQLADFNAMVVHDLRSPLSNIVSMAESVKEGLFGEVNTVQRNWLAKIEIQLPQPDRSGERLFGLLADRCR